MSEIKRKKIGNKIINILKKSDCTKNDALIILSTIIYGLADNTISENKENK